MINYKRYLGLSPRRALCLFLICFAGLLLTACDSGEPKRMHWGAKDLESAHAEFVRIQASYEVIKTGEIVDFDYIMSCYNAEVRGSFRGVEHPPNMYKVTKDRAVISITHPPHYCSNGAFASSPRFEKYFGLATHDRDPYRAPIIGWFEDVEDLRVGYFYVSNDAYKSPRAKVRFIDYKASRATRDEYKAYVIKTEDEYVQIGALPGPFGCTVNSSAHTCNDDEVKARNKGAAVASAGRIGLIKTMRIPEVKSLVPPFLNEYRPHDVGRKYFCRGLEYDAKTGEHIGWPLEPFKEYEYYQDYVFPDQSVPKFKRLESWKHYELYKVGKKYKNPIRSVIRLDPDALKGLVAPEMPIEEIYPILHFKNPRLSEVSKPEGIFQILYDPTWRGYKIIHTHHPGPFKVPEYAGEENAALYINDELACESSWVTPWKLLDVKRGMILNTFGGYQ